MIANAAPLLYIVLGLSAIVLPLFCSVTSFVHSEVYSLGKYVFFFFFLFTALLCFRFYMVDGKLARTSNIVKATSKLSSCIIHVVTAVFVLQGWSTWTSSVPYWVGLKSAQSMASRPPLYITDNLPKYLAIWSGTSTFQVTGYVPAITVSQSSHLATRIHYTFFLSSHLLVMFCYDVCSIFREWCFQTHPLMISAHVDHDQQRMFGTSTHFLMMLLYWRTFLSLTLYTVRCLLYPHPCICNGWKRLVYAGFTRAHIIRFPLSQTLS